MQQAQGINLNRRGCASRQTQSRARGGPGGLWAWNLRPKCIGFDTMKIWNTASSKPNRVYFTFRHRQVVFLLAGGDKSTQSADIRNAIALAKEI